MHETAKKQYRMAKQGKAPLDRTLATLGALDRDSLVTLTGIIDGLLTDEDIVEEDLQPVSSGQSTASSPAGHIELKMIPKGNAEYGPYAYLRWWEGKTHKSKYLGRASDYFKGKGGQS